MQHEHSSPHQHGICTSPGLTTETVEATEDFVEPGILTIGLSSDVIYIRVGKRVGMQGAGKLA
jgi:hypothetical protein